MALLIAYLIAGLIFHSGFMADYEWKNGKLRMIVSVIFSGILVIPAWPYFVWHEYKAKIQEDRYWGVKGHI